MATRRELWMVEPEPPSRLELAAERCVMSLVELLRALLEEAAPAPVVLPMPPAEERLLRPAEVALRIGRSRSWVYEAIRRGMIEVVLVAGRPAVRAAWLDGAIRSGAIGGEDDSPA